ncbi:hypothetical protein AA637_03205 [Cyanobacterium sp. HL-69]|uniref:hypothetical protein n=1 Tax=Cyanobacterium sp. HL-69 TaxID=2054282 RepID=UPI000CA10CAE|nr:hypothetical protein AA637_03205 [Cyanobacterium sp. HL-69]
MIKIKLKWIIALGTFISPLFFTSTHSHASHWLECNFEVKINQVSATHVRISPKRFRGGDGSIEMDRRSCLRAIGNSDVPMSQVNQGKNLLHPGAILHGRWAEYGAMTPNGAISSRGWSFTPLPKDD